MKRVMTIVKKYGEINCCVSETNNKFIIKGSVKMGSKIEEYNQEEEKMNDHINPVFGSILNDFYKKVDKKNKDALEMNEDEIEKMGDLIDSWTEEDGESE